MTERIVVIDINIFTKNDDMRDLWLFYGYTRSQDDKDVVHSIALFESGQCIEHSSKIWETYLKHSLLARYFSPIVADVLGSNSGYLTIPTNERTP